MVTAAQLNAYLGDAGIVVADQAKLSADQATAATDSGVVANGLDPAGQAVLDSATPPKFVTTFDPVTPPTNPPSFIVKSYPLAS